MHMTEFVCCLFSAKIKVEKSDDSASSSSQSSPLPKGEVASVSRAPTGEVKSTSQLGGNGENEALSPKEPAKADKEDEELPSSPFDDGDGDHAVKTEIGEDEEDANVSKDDGDEGDGDGDEDDEEGSSSEDEDDDERSHSPSASSSVADSMRGRRAFCCLLY